MRQIHDMCCAGFGAKPRNEIAERIDSAGWGLFVLWVGVSLLLDVGWGIGFLGVGILTLSLQVLRRSLGLGFEGFWVLVGSGFTLAGIGELRTIDVSLIPILLMAFGVFVLVSAVTRARG